MSIFIRERNGKYYLVTRVKIEKRWKEKWTPLQDKDLEILTKALQIKEEISKQIVEVPCANPYCKNTIKMTPTQKRDFLIKFKKKYDKVVLVCCSKECQQNRIDVLCISGLSRRPFEYSFGAMLITVFFKLLGCVGIAVFLVFVVGLWYLMGRWKSRGIYGSQDRRDD